MIDTLLLTKVILYSDFLNFYLVSRSSPGFHPGYHITVSCLFFLDSSRGWTFQTFLALMTLTVLRFGQVFCGMPPQICGFSHDYIGILVLEGRKYPEVKGHFHHITSRARTIDMTYHC